MTDITKQTLASIVTGNHHAVPVLEKHQLDFCCKGKRTLADACREKGLDAAAIARELTVVQRESPKQMPFSEMTAEQLIGYIEVNHHFYIKRSMPVIYAHLEKVATKHGDRYPFMKEAFRLFSELQDEMVGHLLKEETVIFPHIIETEKLFAAHQENDYIVHEIKTPLAVLENEHEDAGDLMFAIRAVTNGYTAPPDACTTFRITLEELREFEEDLHKHVHLENNILFPKARRPWVATGAYSVGG